MSYKCKNVKCTNCLKKFEPQQYPPFYDPDPNSRLKNKIIPPTKIEAHIVNQFPKYILQYEKYDLRKI